MDERVKDVPERDGPFLKNITIEKRPLNSLGQKPATKMVSIQPSRRRSAVSGQAIDAVLPPKKTSFRPGVKIIRTHESVIRTLESNDVVVRLPFYRSFRASAKLIFQYIAIAGIAVTSAYSTAIGQWFVAGFAVYVLLRRRPSQTTFAVALFTLVTVPFFQLLGQSGVSNNMAVYVYELLVLGTIQALIELKWPVKRKKTAKGLPGKPDLS